MAPKRRAAAKKKASSVAVSKKKPAVTKAKNAPAAKAKPATSNRRSANASSVSGADVSDDEIDFAKMTVAQLKAECTKKGLDTSGVKAALVKRLRDSENGIVFCKNDCTIC